MISATDLRKGTCFEWDGQIYSVMDFQHNKHGRGSAVVWVKMRNIQTGASRENTFNPTDKFEQVSFEEKQMTYLYNDGDIYYFMDPETYEQFPYNKSMVEDALPYILENTNVIVKFFKGEVFSVSPQLFVILQVTATEPGLQGRTPGCPSAHRRRSASRPRTGGPARSRKRRGNPPPACFSALRRPPRA